MLEFKSLSCNVENGTSAVYSSTAASLDRHYSRFSGSDAFLQSTTENYF